MTQDEGRLPQLNATDADAGFESLMERMKGLSPEDTTSAQRAAENAVEGHTAYAEGLEHLYEALLLLQRAADSAVPGAQRLLDRIAHRSELLEEAQAAHSQRDSETEPLDEVLHSTNEHVMTRQALSSTLRPAIKRGEFQLEYQPLVGMGDGRLRGVEALARWHHPQFGTLTPNRFIAPAEEDGSIVPLGRWVLATACRQARRWQLERPDEPPIFVSVNVAVRQVRDSDLVADVAKILAETGLPSHLLQLELTEPAIMGSAGRPLQVVQALGDMGVGIAIDGFGSGYSNLAYLSRLPVSALKLDGSFVRGFQYEDPPNPVEVRILEGVISLAHALNLTVTAECVETTSQAAHLRIIGCDMGQGELYSRPVPADRISVLMEMTEVVNLR